MKLFSEQQSSEQMDYSWHVARTSASHRAEICLVLLWTWAVPLWLKLKLALLMQR